MLIPREVFAPLAAIAPERDTRRMLNGIHLERGDDGKPWAVATCGRAMIALTWPESSGEDLPDSYIGENENGRAKVNGFYTIIPRDDWIAMGKDISKNNSLPILNHSVVEESLANGTLTTRAGKLGSVTTRTITTIEGKYPEWHALLPERRDDDIEIAFDASILANLLKALTPLAERKHHSVIFRIPRRDSAKRPMRIEARSFDGPTVEALIMPIKIHEIEKGDDE